MCSQSVAGLRAAREAEGELLLVLDNTLDAVEAGRLRIERYLQPLAVDPLLVNRLEVVFEELVSNIVRHGFDPGADQSILVALGARPRGLQLTIADNGRPFNPLDLAEPPPFQSLDAVKVGGLGVATVRRFCADLRYEAFASSSAWSALVGAGERPANTITLRIVPPARR